MNDPIPRHSPIRAVSLTDQVYGAISEMLLDSTLKPDSRTSIRELADQLGVSTMPVREAVGRLIAQGALAIRRNKAVEVPQMSAADFRDLVHTRILMECEAARLAVDRMQDAEIEAIRSLHLKYISAFGARNDRSDALGLNRRLHFALYDAARSPSLRQLIGMAWLRAGPLISLDIGPQVQRERASHSIEAHGQLVDALTRRDREGAAEAIRADLSAAAATILEHRSFFHWEEGSDEPEP
ncbi:GntR family transcriptional regulator [Paenirhodobacter populi]|uniref:GntR family transcriptional regulator n=1 Tax=Paenirhodobacter populi TaxID=2306993 RepID=A0A443JBS6_9RHOB|nr:GntR family transcriptional regulator [Sinirhodobacter populi]RWR06391.1 GntR family transcriptional regulator [Sinirhodobacter populi]RWR17934.1 GntR family transcriptional regulator [Sinirhodobacter populi]RWR27012.1 GntR family transcriptional regulator [Sinirhodobacter populi]